MYRIVFLKTRIHRTHTHMHACSMPCKHVSAREYVSMCPSRMCCTSHKRAHTSNTNTQTHRHKTRTYAPQETYHIKHRHTDTQTHRHTDTHTHRHIRSSKNISHQTKTHRLTDTQTHAPQKPYHMTDRQTADRHTHTRHTHLKSHIKPLSIYAPKPSFPGPPGSLSNIPGRARNTNPCAGGIGECVFRARFARHHTTE